MAEPFRMVSLCGRFVADLQWRDGHKQKRWARRTGLADHVWLQHVSVSRLEMGRWNLVRAYASPDCFGRWVPHAYSGDLALAERNPAMGTQPWRNRTGWRDFAGSSRWPLRHHAEGRNRDLSCVHCSSLSRLARGDRNRNNELLAVSMGS